MGLDPAVLARWLRVDDDAEVMRDQPIQGAIELGEHDCFRLSGSLGWKSWLMGTTRRTEVNPNSRIIVRLASKSPCLEAAEDDSPTGLNQRVGSLNGRGGPAALLGPRVVEPGARGRSVHKRRR